MFFPGPQHFIIIAQYNIGNLILLCSVKILTTIFLTVARSVATRTFDTYHTLLGILKKQCLYQVLLLLL